MTGGFTDLTFDLNDTIENFQIAVKNALSYDGAFSLSGVGFTINLKENPNLTLFQFLCYHAPQVLDENQIGLVLREDLGYGYDRRQRIGVKLLNLDDKNLIMSSQGNEQLRCAISRELITNAIYLNGRFYERDLLADYIGMTLRNNMQALRNRAPVTFTDPMGGAIEHEYIQELLEHIEANTGLEGFTNHTIKDFLLQNAQGESQVAYDAMLMDTLLALRNGIENRRQPDIFSPF